VTFKGQGHEPKHLEA